LSSAARDKPPPRTALDIAATAIAGTILPFSKRTTETRTMMSLHADLDRPSR
jgi:hypothetical protein